MNSENIAKTQYFQWLKGEHSGKVVEWHGDIINDEDLGANFLQFKDGSRANETLLGDWLLEVRSANFEDLILQPELANQTQTAYTQPVVTPAPQTYSQQTIATQSVISSPIQQILKDSKKTKSTVTASVVVDIPPINLMAVLSETYEDGEAQVLKFIAESINLEDIRQQLANQIWLKAFDNPIKPTKKQTRNVE